MKNRQTFPGEELYERRKEMGLSPQDVFAEIHVPVEFVIAFERGDLPAFPSGSYAVGFLRSYCRLLNLPPERYIDSLRMCLAPPPTRFFPSKTIRQRNRNSSWIADALTWATVLAVLALGWLRRGRPQ